jgi:gluconate 2-dehydrogenase gamma chain
MNRRTALLVLGVAPASLAAATGNRFFSQNQFAAICDLCERIIPADAESGGAVEAKVPELIDLLVSENHDYQLEFIGGLSRIDEICRDRYSKEFLECTSDQKEETLSGAALESGPYGLSFYTLLRDLTLAGYFTSEIGMKYLGYRGNRFSSGFPGCPPLP